MKRTLLIIVIFLQLLVLTACTEDKSSHNELTSPAPRGAMDESVYKATVIKYNQLLPKALKSSSDVLKGVAIERERGRVQLFMSEIFAENKVMAAQLQDLKFSTIKVLNSKEWQVRVTRYQHKHEQDKQEPGAGELALYHSAVQVDTEETWEYQYVDAQTRKTIGKPEQIKYSDSYYLVQKDHVWQVADIDFNQQAN